MIYDANGTLKTPRMGRPLKRWRRSDTGVVIPPPVVYGVVTMGGFELVSSDSQIVITAG